ncbi:hypothetical protein C1645_820229 [Glomus cerebriforme]|uniref:Uncharacterized protein n=1 Tax=Glomus cerebriforme TaxID=658196 RepID=A0A397T2N5_9GLOM|nr:hypothetical protein C1645_820229 [Glomus cerebriforme]
MDYFKQTSPNKYRFLDFYRHRQKDNDFTRSFRREADELLRCLTSLKDSNSKETRDGAVRLLSNFEGHRTKYEDVDIFWKQIENEVSMDSAETEVACKIIYRSAGVVETAITNVEEKMKQNRKCTSVHEKQSLVVNEFLTPTKEYRDLIPTLPNRKRRRGDFQSKLIESDDEDEEEKESSDSDESSDEEGLEMSEDILETFDKAIRATESKWKLSNGELVKNVLSEKTSNVLESAKNAKKMDAYTASVIRLGLSSIVDLSSEFKDGMMTWFGDEWVNLKQKVQNKIKMVPMKFEGNVLNSIMIVENVSMLKLSIFGSARVLARPNERSFCHENASPSHEDILHNGETFSKTSTARRRIDLRIETRNRHIELCHIECARAPTPAKTVRDRSKTLRTNKSILDNYLRFDISDEVAENSAIYAFQFSGLHGQLIAIDLLDDGLYFGLEGPVFKFPSQLSNIKTMRQTLETLYFFKKNVMQRASAISQYDVETNPYQKVFHNAEEKKSEPKHKKAKFIRSTYFTERRCNKK